jgi:hypothetical protein
MRDEDKRRLMRDLIHIAEETRQFKPPYIPSRYLHDLANSDPGELVERYVLAKNPTDGFHRLWHEQRLDLTVENVAWKHRRLFREEVGRAAADRLAQAGFDVRTQSQLPSH